MMNLDEIIEALYSGFNQEEFESKSEEYKSVYTKHDDIYDKVHTILEEKSLELAGQFDCVYGELMAVIECVAYKQGFMDCMNFMFNNSYKLTPGQLECIGRSIVETAATSLRTKILKSALEEIGQSKPVVWTGGLKHD